MSAFLQPQHIGQQQQQPPVDMTTKVGGRIFAPALPVVDGLSPTAAELGFQATLDVYSAEHIPLEGVDGIQRRERVLNRMGSICREWIRSVCLQRGLPPDVANNAGGQLFTSGSYRLGVHEPGADIDTILVAPSMCRRQDFFGTSTITEENITRDPNSLAERIRRQPDVTNFVPVEGAAVPLLTFDWEGVNIDLLFARLNSNSVPVDFDIDHDAVLDGVDSATEKSLNGPRVTNLIAAFVSGTPTRYQTFLSVVRCVRKWAKARGLYSNKMGYLGGVNINIGVALAIQLYPNACPAVLLRKFFLVFKTWRWPQPVMLTKPHDAGYGLAVWTTASAARQIAPMITPAYPAMNSTLSISRQTLQILQEEFNRGHEIMDSMWKEYQKTQTLTTQAWKTLFENSDFFINYPNYLSLCIVGPTQADAQAWIGFVESRLRKLVSDLLARSLPIKKIQLWPKKISACVADRAALLTAAQRQNCITYFIGFLVDRLRMRGDQLNMEIAFQNFREWELSRYQPLLPGMDVLVKTFHVKELPRICFDDIYDGGKLEAMKKRRQLRDSDPARLEKKRLARLETLKAKMAEIQRRKEEQEEQEEAAAAANKKRKREEEEDVVEEEKIEGVGAGSNSKQLNDSVAASTGTVVKQEADLVSDQPGDVADADETNLLESALDYIQQAAGDVAKTREQAEADRLKLLSGEANDGMDEDGLPGPSFSDDEGEEAAYTGDGARLMIYGKQPASSSQQQQQAQPIPVVVIRDKRCLPVDVADAEMLSKMGFSVVTDDESQVLGHNLLPPWTLQGANDNTGKDENSSAAIAVAGGKEPVRYKINFRTKFDVVELDANGHVIDKGDENFSPSKRWMGRKPGFEFKLGERGVGYYRTGHKVVVPSNTAYTS